MKLLIQTDLEYSTVFNEDGIGVDFDEFKADAEHLVKDLKRFAVHSKLDLTERRCLFTVVSQKVTLDDINMNTLLHDLYETFDDLVLEYAGLGGEGCEVSLRLTQEKQL